MEAAIAQAPEAPETAEATRMAAKAPKMEAEAPGVAAEAQRHQR